MNVTNFQLMFACCSRTAEHLYRRQRHSKHSGGVLRVTGTNEMWHKQLSAVARRMLYRYATQRPADKRLVCWHCRMLQICQITVNILSAIYSLHISSCVLVISLQMLIYLSSLRSSAIHSVSSHFSCRFFALPFHLFFLTYLPNLSAFTRLRDFSHTRYIASYYGQTTHLLASSFATSWESWFG